MKLRAVALSMLMLLAAMTGGVGAQVGDTAGNDGTTAGNDGLPDGDDGTTAGNDGSPDGDDGTTAGNDETTDTSDVTTAGTDGAPAGEIDVGVGDLDGNGTDADPYVVTNASELQAIEDDTDASYVLGADIDATGTATWNDGAGFDPLGTRGDPFTGSLEGRNYTITELSIDRPEEFDVGLFGYINGGTVRNVTLVDVNVTGDGRTGGLVGTTAGTVSGAVVSGSVTGQDGVGGLVGFAEGPVTDSVSTATVEGTDSVGGLVGRNTVKGTVKRSTAGGTVTGQDNVGGLVGTTAASVRRSSSNATVNGGDYVGGLVGAAASGDEMIRRSYATGSVIGDYRVGGLVGQDGTIVESYATTAITSDGDAGGLAGEMNIIRDSYWNTNTTGADDGGGYRDGGSGGGLTTDQMTGEAAVTNMSRFDFERTWQPRPNDYPDLAVNVDRNVAPAPTDDQYSVRTGTELSVSTAALLANDVDADRDSLAVSGIAARPTNGSVNLTNGTIRYTPESSFFGKDQYSYQVTDSNGGTGTATVTVSTLPKSQVDVDPSDLGGSGTESDPYVITNISELQAIEDDTDAAYVLGNEIDASQTARWNGQRGFDPIPSFTGRFDGQGYTISNLSIDRPAEKTVGLFERVSTDRFRDLRLSSVNITGGNYTGALAGDAAESVTNVTVSGRVDGREHTGGLVGSSSEKIHVRIVGSTTGATVNGTSSVGGIIGSEGDILNSTSTATVSGADNVGGLVGAGTYPVGEIRNSSANVTVTGENAVGGLVGAEKYHIRSSEASGYVDGNRNVGGLGGQLTILATVQNSTASARVNGSENVGGVVGSLGGEIYRSRAVGNVTGNTTVGGFVGLNIDDPFQTGEIRDVSARGSVRGGSRVGGIAGENAGQIENVVAVGPVQGASKTGGIFGVGSSLNTGYWDVEATGQLNATGEGVNDDGVGLTTAQMTGEAARTNMSALPFESTWRTGPAYPLLASQDVIVSLPPNATDESYAVEENVTLSVGAPGVLANDVDENGDELSVNTTPVRAPSKGRLELEPDGSFDYTPDAGVTGDDTFTYRVSDGNGGTDTATVTLSILRNEVDADPDDLDGSGTNADPYVVTNVSELQAMEDDTDASYVLGNDIAAGATDGWNDRAGFEPVGPRTDPFTGTFDGKNHTITGLTIDRDAFDVGLFGHVDGGTVENVTLDDVDVTGGDRVGALAGTASGKVREVTVRGTVTGDSGVGGALGFNEGSVDSATSTATVNGTESVGGLVGRNTYKGTVASSSSRGVVGGAENVGGLIGTNAGPVTRSTSAATVTGERYAGGLVGRTVISSATVSLSTATGTVTGERHVGGLVGQGGTISDSYATTTVEGREYTGGLTGSPASLVVDAYWDTETTGQDDSRGEESGFVEQGEVTGLTTAQMTGDTARTNMTGLDFEAVWQTRSQGYPRLGTRVGENVAPDAEGESYSTLSRSKLVLSDSELLENDADADRDTLRISRLTTTPPNGSAVLTDQGIEYTPEPGFAGRETFSYEVTDGNGGTDTETVTVVVRVDVDTTDLDGNGTETDPYIVTNASELQAIEDDTDAAYVLGSDIDASLTGSWNNGTGFTPLGTRDDPFNGTLDGAGHTITGLRMNRTTQADIGLFGFIDSGTVRNVTLTNTTITGDERVGSLAGTSNGTVRNVTADGTVAGEMGVGGLLGFNEGTVAEAGSGATVDGHTSVGGLVGRNTYRGTIRDARSDGRVLGEEEVGGLVGTNGNTITRTVSTANVTGRGDVGGLVGKTVISSATVSNSAAMGHVNGGGGLVGEGGTIRDSYAAVTFDNPDVSSGIVNQYATRVENSYWDTTTTGVSEASGNRWTVTGSNVTGLTTEEMTGEIAAANMIGLDFGSVWRTQVDDYPTLGAVEGNNRDPVAANRTVTTSRNQSVSIPLTELADDPDGGSVTLVEIVESPSNGKAEIVDDTIVYRPDAGFVGEDSIGYAVKDDEGDTDTGRVTVNVTLSLEDLSGDGSESDPYVIRTVDGLQLMKEDTDANYVLGNDIDAAATSTWNDGKGFDPVGLGTEGGLFSGTLDGDGHTISNLTIDRPTEDYVGLFGIIELGSVRDVRLTDVNVTGDRSVGGLAGKGREGDVSNVTVQGRVAGNTAVGGVAGSTSGFTNTVVRRLTANVTVEGVGRVGGLVGISRDETVIAASSASGTIQSSEAASGQWDVGGLVGVNHGTVRNSSSAAAVSETTGQGTDLGGLVGENSRSGSVIRSSATGSVRGDTKVGGLVGNNNYRATVKQSWATASVTGNSSVGGLVGYDEGTIADTYAAGQVDGGNQLVGRLGDSDLYRTAPRDSYYDVETAGQPDPWENVTGLTTEEMTGDAARSNMTGLDFETVWVTVQDEYPKLAT